MTSAAWRRQWLAAAAGALVHAAARKIAAEHGISHEESVALVFQDRALLARCHQVGGAPVPDMPLGPVSAQNRGGA